MCYGIIPLLVDLTETHAFHPDWPAHARFHMVWLLGTNTSLAILSLILMWGTKIEPRLRICIGGLIGLCVFGGFFISSFTANLYGGALVDEMGGVPPIFGMDANLVAFTPLTALVVIGLWLAFRHDVFK
jgi:hypothetical protein